MRAAVLVALMLGGCAQSPGKGGGDPHEVILRGGRGGGIVSVNPCADAVLVRLVPASRIAAISHYSQEPGATSIPLDVARRFRVTAGTAEEVIALHPDLVVASSFTPPATQAAYTRAGLKTLLLDQPATIAESKAQVMQIAEAVGEGARGRAMTAGIDRAVARWSAPPDAPRPSALLYITGDLATGKGTLLDELMTRAGLTNAAATYGLAFTGRLAAETLVAHPPAVVIAPPVESRAAAVRDRLLPHTPKAAYPRALVNCGGPAIPPALARLAAIRRAL